MGCFDGGWTYPESPAAQLTNANVTQSIDLRSGALGFRKLIHSELDRNNPPRCVHRSAELIDECNGEAYSVEQTNLVNCCHWTYIRPLAKIIVWRIV